MMVKEFNLSEKMMSGVSAWELTKRQKGISLPCFIDIDDVKEFIKKREFENRDLRNDVLALVEINDYGKADLISKLKRLFSAHKQERDKLAGKKLI